MPKTTSQVRNIEGWGADLDPKNRPAVPMEKRSNVFDPYGPKLPRQKPTVRIHLSREHRHLTPVFGTSCPPKLLSGLLRNFAYTYSEGRMLHWLTLLAADRVDVVESVITDLFKGKLPRPVKEMGLKAERLRNPPHERSQRYLMAAGVGLGAIVITVLFSSAIRPAPKT